MDIKIIDAHTHVHFPEFDGDRDAVIKRAQEKGIGMITIGTDLALTKKAIEVAQKYEGVWATAGIHPHEAKRFTCINEIKKEVVSLEAFAKEKTVVGIGECGIDLFREDDKNVVAMQKELFIVQLEVAHRLKKPVVIHSRGSENGSLDGLEMILEILEARSHLLTKKGVCHFFTGTKEIADRFLALGFSFTFCGLVTFNRGFDEVMTHIPIEHILVETDAPFVAPLSHRGERNEPSYVTEVFPVIARCKGIEEEVVRTIILKNTYALFCL